MDLPDDIWIEVFQLLPRRQLAATIQRTCRRFHRLAATPLLRHIVWLTPAQIERELFLWKTVNANRVMLPRSLCITPHLEWDNQTSIWDSIPVPMMTPQRLHFRNLYHSIHVQVSLFTSLRTLTISNIALSEDTYRAFQHIPTLRSLRILNSEYHTLSFKEERERANLPEIQLSALPITDLCLHNVRFQLDDRFSLHHPVRLLICPSLTSLAITWDSSMSQGYQFHIHDPLSRNLQLQQHQHPYHRVPTHAATNTHPRASPNLTDIQVRIPLLEDKFADGLVSLISPPQTPLVHPFRVKILVIKTKHTGSEFAIARARQSGVNEYDFSTPDSPSYVWSYTGPLLALGAFVPSKWDPRDFPVPPHAEVASDGLSTPLTQLHFRPPGDHVSYVVHRLELLMSPLELEHLEVCIHSWDVEILFAIRELCPNVVRVVVRYGEGTMDEDQLIALGSPIFSRLKRLHTLRLILDPRCAKDAVMPKRRVFDTRALYRVEREDPSEPDLYEDEDDFQPEPLPEPEETPADEPEDNIPFEDCLAGWHRYCPSLRRVQIGGGTKGVAWRRRWDIDAWHKVWVEDLEDPEERGDSHYGLGDESDGEDEGEIWCEYGNST